MHAHTMRDVLACLEFAQVPFTFEFAIGMLQPQAQNYALEKALTHNPDYVWIVDDDMQFPVGILKEMLDTGEPFVVADYPVIHETRKHTVDARNGFQFAGLGCVLLKPEVLKNIDRPYFRRGTHYVWNLDHYETNPAPESDPQPYHDVDLFQRLKKAGVVPVVIETTAGQYTPPFTFPKRQPHTIETFRFE